eukprot:TRINITY_DN26375_c0_g1_i1.p1 TRINITY_DN26375_c0_g1~~TRINITY_DN26375_c0_g1_i1.p1  ORF type:complete len:288 (-),score=42.48 TRINITY_DN26375_c0_g1_i1:203-1066(-)
MGQGCSEAVKISQAVCFRGLFSAASSLPRSPFGTPLPEVLHRTLQRTEVCPQKGGRLVFVGDVHGCSEELKLLLDAEGFDKRQDTLIFVGDLVNKGPASGEVVSIARQNNALAVRGNHDDELLEAFHRVGRFANGLETYRHDALYQVSEEDVKWVQELPLSITFPWLKLIVVHAGLVPGVPIHSQKPQDLMWIRDVRPIFEEGGRWQGLEKAFEESKPWASVWSGPEHVVFGHDAKRKLQLYEHATGLDTGCCYGNTLSALVVDPDCLQDRRLVQVQAKNVYSLPKG